MTGSFMLSSCSVFLPIIKLLSTRDHVCTITAGLEQPLVEDTHTCTALSFVTFDCAGIEGLSVPQRNSCVSLGEPICIVC